MAEECRLPTRESARGIGRQGVDGSARRWLEASEDLPVLTYSVTDLPNVRARAGAVRTLPAGSRLPRRNDLVPARKEVSFLVGTTPGRSTLPLAREAVGVSVSELVRSARRIEDPLSWGHAASREGGLRGDALGGRCLSRGAPFDAARHGRRWRERGSRRRQFTSPPAASCEGGRRRCSNLPSPRREGGRRRPPKTLAASSERGTLDNDGLTLAFSRGRRILHAKAGKIR